MKLNERFPMTDSFPVYSGIATYLFYNNLASVDIDSYLKSYLNSKKQQFDYSSLMLFGERECNMIMNMSPDDNHVLQTQLMQLTFAHYKEKWTSLFNMLNSESGSDYHDYNPIENYNMVENEEYGGDDLKTGTDTNSLTHGEAVSKQSSGSDALLHGESISKQSSGSDALLHGESISKQSSGSDALAHGENIETRTKSQAGDTVETSVDAQDPVTTKNSLFGFNTVSASGAPDSMSVNTGTSKSTTKKDDEEIHTGTDTHTLSGSESESHTGTDTHTLSGSETEGHSGTDTRTLSGTESETHSGTDSGSTTYNNNLHKTFERELTRSGNIGVTTTQQMMEQEIAIRQEYEFFNIVLKDIIDLFTYPVY